MTRNFNRGLHHLRGKIEKVKERMNKQKSKNKCKGEKSQSLGPISKEDTKRSSGMKMNCDFNQVCYVATLTLSCSLFLG